jgi:hypothetical protein
MTNVVGLYVHNFRDAPATLRHLADRIDAGEYGDVTCVGVSLLGDGLSVFGCGKESEPADTALVLHAGFQFLMDQFVNR